MPTEAILLARPLPALDDLPAFPTSTLKSRTGTVLDRQRHNVFALTRHNRRDYVVIDAEIYEALRKQIEGPNLVAMFDDLVARMNTPEAKKGFDALFKATPEALGEAAVKAAANNG